MGHLSPFTEPSVERYSSALFGRLPELLFVDVDFLDVNLGEKSVAMEFFLGLSLEMDVGVEGECAKDNGVSMVVVLESGVNGVKRDESEICLCFLSRE